MLGEQCGGLDQLADLGLFLEDRLEQGQLQPRLGMEGKRSLRDVLARAAQHESVEKFVGDEVPGCRVILGAPCLGDPVPQLAVEARTPKRHVRQHGHHVDHERLALGAVESLPAGLVDQAQEVASRLDRFGIAPSLRSRGP